METQKNTELFTIITGASTGLGKAMAIECATRKMNLILVALPGRNLELFCKQLEFEHKITAVCYEIDLTDKQQIIEMSNSILEKYSVNFLINNAGMGGSVEIEASSVDYIDNIILLNIRALSILTRLFIPELKKHKKSFILNVSSMAAFSPMPFKTVYPASKSFVYSFSRSLRQELKETSIKVSVVHPGPILTNPDVIGRIVKQGIFGKIGLLSGLEITQIALNSIDKGKSVIIPGIMNKINRFLMLIVPTEIRLPFMYRLVKRELMKA